MLRAQAEESTSMTTHVTPRPMKNAVSEAAMTSAPAPNRAVWKKSASRPANSALCPASRKIHGDKGTKAKNSGMQ